MFILIAEYLRPLEEVRQQIGAHREWLRAQYEAGRILVSGPMVPPPGGAIVMRAESREELDELLEPEPFQRLGLARYAVHEFAPTDGPLRSAAFDQFISAAGT